MTPVKVRIVNRSGRPVRILYESFALEGASGRTFSPLPPVPLEAEQHPDVTPVRPVFTNSGFFVAAAYRALFPALDPWPERLPRDDAKAEELYRQWDDGLPTREMRRMALLEGVLDAGGQASGFLYFERRAHREKRLLFQAELVDARDGDGISFVKIPFHID
jgi:hypothetical protein